MSENRVPAPVEALIRAIAGDPHDDDDQRATTFARGLALGALVGAAIAGSTLWQRRHGRATVTAATRVEPAIMDPPGTEPAAHGWRPARAAGVRGGAGPEPLA